MRTSFLVTMPTSIPTISSETLVLLMPSSTERMASAEPKTSVLMMSLSTLACVAAMLANSCSTETSFGTAAAVVMTCLRRNCSSSASFSASRLFFTALNVAPLSGVPDQPMTRTGVPGGASLRFSPLSSNIARTLA